MLVSRVAPHKADNKNQPKKQGQQEAAGRAESSSFMVSLLGSC